MKKLLICCVVKDLPQHKFYTTH